MKRRTLAILFTVVFIMLATLTPQSIAQSSSDDLAWRADETVLVAPALAPRADEYSMTWYVVGGGAYMTSADGSYTFGATAGQSAVGALSGGDYALQAGFWGGITDGSSLYLPLILK